MTDMSEDCTNLTKKLRLCRCKIWIWKIKFGYF